MIKEEQTSYEPLHPIKGTLNVPIAHLLGPEGDASGAPLLAGPPAIPYGAGLRLVLAFLLLLLSVHFCPRGESDGGLNQADAVAMTSNIQLESLTLVTSSYQQVLHDEFRAFDIVGV